MPQTTIRPVKPVTETVADILILGNHVKITFFEKDSDFKDLIKSHGFRWGGEGWERKCNKFTGSTLDRATEIAIKLLKANYIVCIVDDVLKDRILKKEYEPEQKRWIAQRVEGKFKDWFSISWEYGNEEIYKASRVVAGSRWSSPNVVIPSYQYEAILDLVDKFDFKLSEGAIELIAEAKKTREEALVVDMSEVELPTSEQTKEKETEAGIHASLRDDD